MANHENSYTGSQGSGTGNAFFDFTFPTYTTSEVRVEVDNVVKTLTTHYTVTNYNTTSGGKVRFTTGNIPTGTTPVRIFRQTDVDNPKATFTAGSALKAGEINDNFKQLRHALQEAVGADSTNRKIQPFNIEDGAITSAAIKDLTVARGDIANDAIDGTKIADDSVDSEHFVADSIDTEHYAPGSIDATAIGTDAVTRDKIFPDAIDSTKIADNAVNSEHYVDGSIDHEHLAHDIIDGDNIQDDVINSEHYVADSIDTEHYAPGSVDNTALGPDAVDGAKLADNAVDSEHYVDGSIDHVHLSTDAVDGDNIANDSINSEHYVDGSIDHQHLSNDCIDSDNIQDNAVNSEHYVDGSIDHVHLANDIIDGDNIQDDVINSEHIVAGALDNEHYAAGSITSDKLNGATVITAAEQGSATANDTSFLTSAAADARYFNISSGDTIKDGQSFPDNDTTIATTAAINDRIIDLVDDVGGFVPIANETSFPTANPDVNNGSGTLVSIKTISSTRTPNSGTVTIANGSGSNTVTITGCGSTVLTAGFGVIVETTSTLHTYAFHRLVPKATEVTTVAGISGNVTTVANNIADINTVAADLNESTSEIDTVATNIANVNTVGNAIANVNTTAGSIANVNTTAGSIANVNTTAGSITNVNTVAGSIANVNTVGNNISQVNSFANLYRIASSDPSTNNDEGDLYFNTTSNELRVYNGSTWQGGVTATGNLAGLGANTFTGNQTIQNSAPKLIFSDTNNNPDYQLINEAGTFLLYDSTNGADKLKVQADGHIDVTPNTDFANGIDVTGNITVSGTVDGKDVSTLIANVVEDTTPQLGGDLDVNGHQIKVPDLSGADNVIYIGTGSDLQLYHASGGNSYIDDFGSGELLIRGSVVSINKQGSAEVMAKFTQDGAAELYHDNVKKFETTTNGTLMPDDAEARFGAGNDFAIYHDATNDINVINSRGNGGDIEIRHYSEKAIVTKGNGAVELYHNNNKKFETSSTGASLTGNLTVSGTVDGVDIAARDTLFGGITANAGIIKNTVSLADGVTATTQSAGTSNTRVATTAFVSTAIANLVDSSPSALNTLNELAAAIGDDANFSTTITNSIATKMPLAGGEFTGNVISHNITPDTDSIRYLGSNSLRFSKVFADVYEGSGANLTNLPSQTDNNFTDADHSKLDGIAANANNYSHPNHSGEVTSSGDGAMTIADNVVDEANLKVSNSPTNGYFLSAQSGNTGGLTWAQVTTDLVGDTSPQLGGTLDCNGNVIQNGFGSNLILRLSNGEKYFQGIPNGASEIFYDGNVKLATTNTGVNVTGNVVLSNALLPSADSSSDIGTTSVRWRNAYVDTYYGDGSNLTGVASAVADGCIYENSQTISNNYTITTNKNALSAGPITVANGVTLTIPSGSTYTIV